MLINNNTNYCGHKQDISNFLILISNLYGKYMIILKDSPVATLLLNKHPHWQVPTQPPI